MRYFLKSNWIGLAILGLTWLIFFSRILFGGQVYFLDDLKILYYPIEYVYEQAQSTWKLPIWSHNFGFGHPVLAWAQLGFFTPLHLFLRAFQLHPVILLNISTPLYYLFGLVGMFLFFRSQKLSQLSAALGAIVFAFCGFSIGHLNHVNFFTATMLLPWLLLAVHFFLEKPNLQRAALLALIAALIPLSGQPQISLYTFIIAAVFGIIYVRKNVFRIFGFVLMAAVLAFCLASFSILPLREFLPATDRSGDLPIDELYEFSYPFSHLITLVRPYFFGDHENYWGAKNFQELAAYVGFIPLILAPVALFWPNKRFGKLRWYGFSLVIIALLFAPGKYSPVYHFLVENHILTSLAIPGRFVYFFDVGVAILAAVGLEIFLSLLHLRGVAKRYTLEMGVGIVALAAANLIWWGWDYNPLVSKREALKTSPFTETLQKWGKDHGLPARLYSHETLPLTGPFKEPLDLAGLKQTHDLERDLLLRHIHATANVSSARWIGALSIGNYRAFIEQYFANDREPFDGEGEHALARFRNLINMSGITHFMQALPEREAGSDPMLANGYNLIQEEKQDNLLLRLYQNPQVFPKAFLVGTAIWEPGGDQTRHAIGHRQYDPSKLVYISGPSPPDTGTLPNQETPNPAIIPTTSLANSSAVITNYGPIQVDITVSVEKPAWLVLTDSFTTQWQTFIDGAPAPQYIANTVFRAAQIPAGSHTVSFQYHSPAIQQAKVLTYIGVVVTSILLLLPFFRKFVIRAS